VFKVPTLGRDRGFQNRFRAAPLPALSRSREAGIQAPRGSNPGPRLPPGVFVPKAPRPDQTRRAEETRANPIGSTAPAVPSGTRAAPGKVPIRRLARVDRISLGSVHRVCFADRALMTARVFSCWLGILLLALGSVAPHAAEPAPAEGWELESLTDQSRFEYRLGEGLLLGTNGVAIRYGDASLTADVVWLNQQTGEAVAEGRVRILRADQVWVGERILYNFRTRQMEAEQFRTGRPPVFAAAEGLRADLARGVYTATNAWITTDDVAEPFDRIVARHITIVPGQYLELRHATLYLGDIPVFYFPYYRRSLRETGPRWDLIPGYRSRHGAYLLGTYSWNLSPALDGTLHLDYRTQRGPAAGLDLTGHAGLWGNPELQYYYAHDEDPGPDPMGGSLDSSRHRLAVSWLAGPTTNLQLRAQVRYLSDALIEHDFFESEFRRNPQPRTFFEATRFWDHFALELLAEPRINDFFHTVERLPEIRLTGWRQPVGATPLFYESQSSAGFYRLRFPQTNGVAEPRVEAVRADTLHQLLWPWTFADWLHVTPRVGGRLTAYGEAHGPGARTTDHTRALFFTGLDMSFKASRTWNDTASSLLDIDGLRHVVEPFAQYWFVPRPHPRPTALPQFDGLQPSLWLLPLDFPAYNPVDALDRMHLVRLGVHQRLQTKRAGRVEALVDWSVFADWHLEREAHQDTFGDLVSELTLRPRSRARVDSTLRYAPEAGQVRLAFHSLTLEPADRWSWTVGHYYLRDHFGAEPTAWGPGHNLLFHSLLWRWDDNWAFRVSHHVEIDAGQLQEQFYTVYRDFRSWTGALTFRVRNPQQGPTDYAVGFAFSLKAAPKYRPGEDSLRPYGLLGR
jgi:LPS-assembly protein